MQMPSLGSHMEFDSSIEAIDADTIRVRLQFGGRACRDMQLSHPDLGWYMHLMANKAECKDRGGYIYNARRYLRLVDQMIEMELFGQMNQQENHMAKLELGVLVAFVSVLLIAKYHFWLYVGTCALGCAVLLGANLLAMRRHTELLRYLDWQADSFEMRLEAFVAREWGKGCHCIGKSGVTESPKNISPKHGPIPVVTVVLPEKR